MIFDTKVNVLQICQKFHLNNKMYHKPPCNCSEFDNEMPVIFQQGLKQVLLKQCDDITNDWKYTWAYITDSVSNRKG